MTTNYNTAETLWANLRQSGDPVLTVTECGHVLQGGAAIGRFSSKADAVATLTKTGWRHLAGNTLGTFFAGK